MKVTLAYPYSHDGKSHDAGATIDVADDTAAQLIRDGKARAAQGKTTTSKKEG